MEGKRLTEIAKQMQAMARIGLHFASDPYDIERYQQLRQMSVEMLAGLSGRDAEQLWAEFASGQGYQTPMVDVRAVVFNDQGQMLLTQEKSDGGWTPPGGWADIGYSPAQTAEKECLEEAGIQVKAERLLALWDKHCHPDFPPEPLHAYKVFFLCRKTGGQEAPGHETLDARYFAPDALPANLSRPRITVGMLRQLFEVNTNKESLPRFD